MDTNLDTICRGATKIIGRKLLEKKLAEGKTLKVKHGVDPTAPDIHLGYAVIYTVLRRFQDAGNIVQLLIGDFTGRTGDPTDKDIARDRKALSDLKTHEKTMVEQLTTILSKESLEVPHNSDWWDKMTLEEFLGVLRKVSATQLWQREMFKKRVAEEKPVWTDEFLYPVLQGYDSVMLESDVTVIGSDQEFNEQMGRHYQEAYGQEPQALVIMPLLVGTDGTQKMSQSVGNYIGISDAPEDMFGKVMSMPDSNIEPYFTLLTNEGMSKVAEMLKNDNPRDVKMRLASALVSRFHSNDAAKKAQENFVATFQNKETPKEMEELSIGVEKISAIDLLIKAKFATSNSDGRRTIEQGGMKFDGNVVEDSAAELEIPENGAVLQKGKRFFKKVIR